jgi:hypothetical protein
MVSVVNNTNSTANVTASVYKSTATSFSFDAADVPGAATGLAGTGGTATAPKLAYDYTTTNYWLNDPNAQAPLNASGTSSFIASASQWCSTCHTRYLSTSGGTSREVASGDSVFTYRHTSASGSQDSPNCIQCHVAHGSNAVMSGTSGSDEANSPQMNPDDPTANPLVYSNGDHGSKLLRVNNRGICQMCHNK